jgi:hypothetical protein
LRPRVLPMISVAYTISWQRLSRLRSGTAGDSARTLIKLP